MNALNKIIFKTAAEGLVAVAVVFCYGMGIFAFAFPGAMASFYDIAGNTRLSALYHTRVYNRSSTPQNLFNALHANIIAGNDSRTIELGERFFDTSFTTQREAILASEDARMVAGAGEGALAIGLGTNTDNRLRMGVVRAHIAQGNNAQAVQMFEDLAVTEPNQVNVSRPSTLILAFDINDTDRNARFALYHASFVIRFNELRATMSAVDITRAEFFVYDPLELFYGRL